MLVSFPQMGILAIVLKALFTQLGCQVLSPPPTTKRTLELGARVSPETVCLPFKLTLGNFIEALEAGADTLITCGGSGPCRLGYYAAVQHSILQQLGYSCRMVVVEPTLLGIYRQLNMVSPGTSWRQRCQAFQLAGAKLNVLDELAGALNCLRAQEAVAGSADALWEQAATAVDLATDCRQLQELRRDWQQLLQAVRLVPREQRLRIAIVGEIFVMLEPFANQQLERCLGAMGVEAVRTMFLSDYVKGHLLRRKVYQDLYQQLSLLAAPYLGQPVGGHALKSIAYTLLKKEQGYDGIIQVYPFTCMPEVIAKNILPRVSREIDMPVLTLAYDEQTGEAGIKTRLEAFVDLLHLRRQRCRQERNGSRQLYQGC